MGRILESTKDELFLAYGAQTSEVQVLSLGFLVPSHFILW